MKVKAFSKILNKKWVIVSVATSLIVISYVSTTLILGNKFSQLQKQNSSLSNEVKNAKANLDKLLGTDPYKKMNDQQIEIDNIHKTYSQAVNSYEDLLRLKDHTNNTTNLDNLYAQALSSLSNQNYTSASAALNNLETGIKNTETQLATASANQPAANIPVNNTPPGAGYSRQTIKTDVGNFMVSLVAADLSSTKVIVDTASDSTCGDNCPVLPLATYVSRNNAYAGVNGSYFCPSTYPTCVGKTNSFDTLLMNKNKTYFNSDNNVYSTIPAVIFGGSYIRFVSQSLEWGRDTSIDSMIANRPALVLGSNMVFTGGGEPKEEIKGNRGFVANKGNTVFIGVAHDVTMEEDAKVMKALGFENALNLDDGGSTALWSGGYKVGPGRDLPNVILFVKK